MVHAFRSDWRAKLIVVTMNKKLVVASMLILCSMPSCALIGVKDVLVQSTSIKRWEGYIVQNEVRLSGERVLSLQITNLPSGLTETQRRAAKLLPVLIVESESSKNDWWRGRYRSGEEYVVTGRLAPIRLSKEGDGSWIQGLLVGEVVVLK